MAAHPLLTEVESLIARAELAVVLSVVDPASALADGRAVLAEAERLGLGRSPFTGTAPHWSSSPSHPGLPASPAERRTAREREKTAEAASVALRAMALAARELGDLRMAEHCLRRAIALPGTPPLRMAQARLSLVTVRTERGHPLQALRIAALAYARLPPLDRAKLETQRAVALARLGRGREAVAACDRAVAELSSAEATPDNRRFLAGGLLNRGLAHAYLADWPAAVRDITACGEIAREHRLDHLARLATANLPFLAVRQGDIAAAFTHYHACERTLAGFAERLATMRTDFAEALLTAGLPGEARTMLSLALPELEAAGARTALTEARLRLARVELLTGDPRRAAELAARTRAELSVQDGHGWAPLIADILARARLALGRPTAALVTDLLTCADALELTPASADGGASTRLLAAETALDLGDTATASAQLTRLATAPGPAVVRQHALAVAALLDGERGTAFRAVRDGLAGIGARLRTVTDPETRANTARSGARLAALGLRLALDDGRARQIFAWAERWRAVTTGGRVQPVRLSAVRAALGDRVLVEFLVDGGRLAALVIGRERSALRRLGPVDQIGEAVARLRYALRRIHLADSGTAEAAAPNGLDEAASEVEAALLTPLAEEVGDLPLLLVPAGPLHALPWAALPSLRGRPVSVAPSALAWYAAGRDRPHRSGEVAICAGPGLRYAEDEAERVARHHPGAVRIAPRTDAVLAALGRAEVVHLAAHGVFAAHGPLLSSLALDDRPLMAHDLLRVARPPRLVVLSACESGMARVPVEGAALGLAGIFLSQGAGCVVAGLLPVPDAETAALMDVFHRLLAAGDSPDRALARAAERTGARGFACFGAGDLPLGTAGRQPTATGLNGSATQLDHDPRYSAPEKPASSRAISSCAAVTPDPQ